MMAARPHTPRGGGGLRHPRPRPAGRPQWPLPRCGGLRGRPLPLPRRAPPWRALMKRASTPRPPAAQGMRGYHVHTPRLRASGHHRAGGWLRRGGYLPAHRQRQHVDDAIDAHRTPIAFHTAFLGGTQARSALFCVKAVSTLDRQYNLL